MSEFESLFPELPCDRKLSHQEMIGAIRCMVAAEYGTVQLYMQLAGSVDHPPVANMFRNTADEGRVRVGKFLRLLRNLASDEDELYVGGAKEIQEGIAKARLRVYQRITDS